MYDIIIRVVKKMINRARGHTCGTVKSKLRRCQKWQSVVSVARALFSVRTFPTLTARPTEPGSPIFAKLSWKAAKQSTFVPVACAP